MSNVVSDNVAALAGAMAEELADLGGERAYAVVDGDEFLVAIACGGSAKRLRVALELMDEEDNPTPSCLERLLNWLVQGGH